MPEPQDPGGGSRRPGEGQAVLLGAGGDLASRQLTPAVADVYKLTDPALAELALDELLETLLTRVSEILAVDTAAILLLDEPSGAAVATAARGLEEEVEQGVRIPLGAGFAGRIAAERLPIFIADVSHADVLNPILRRKGVRSLLGVPLLVEGKTIGVLHVGTLDPRTFGDEDAAVLQLAAAHAAPAVERARLFAALHEEHRITDLLQRSLLPDRLPDRLGIEVAARYMAARDDVGGDWYDVIEIGRGSIGLAIGDVVGHGVRAASLMGQLRTGLRAYAIDGHPPGTVVERLDHLLGTISESGMATVLYATFDPESGRLACAAAGHPAPLIVSAAGEPRFLELPPAPPLGALPYPMFREVETALAPGETVLLYTDGLVERPAEPLRRGLERLARAAQGSLGADRLCSKVMEDLVGTDEPADDIAIVGLTHSRLPEDRLTLRFPADPRVLAGLRQTLRRWLRDAGADNDEVGRILLACSEACANAIEHAYSPSPAVFEVEVAKREGQLDVAVRDAGHWRAPRGAHRGRGLTIMESFMDEVNIRQHAEGTEVAMRMRLGEDAA
jgi:serine phosphatase RsbU (regulator of sigma subunit)/anti-sigma regulatory factor (Ser/Thr protein kinase)